MMRPLTPYRSTLRTQVIDLLSAIPDALAALCIVAAVMSLCLSMGGPHG